MINKNHIQFEELLKSNFEGNIDQIISIASEIEEPHLCLGAKSSPANLVFEKMIKGDQFDFSKILDAFQISRINVMIEIAEKEEIPWTEYIFNLSNEQRKELFESDKGYRIYQSIDQAMENDIPLPNIDKLIDLMLSFQEFYDGAESPNSELETKMDFIGGLTPKAKNEIIKQLLNQDFDFSKEQYFVIEPNTMEANELLKRIKNEEVGRFGIYSNPLVYSIMNGDVSLFSSMINNNVLEIINKSINEPIIDHDMAFNYSKMNITPNINEIESIYNSYRAQKFAKSAMEDLIPLLKSASP